MKRIYMFVSMLAIALISAVAVADDSIPSGKYIFIPDSLQGDVLRLLKGNSMVVDNPDNLDVDEKVLWKGDTLPMVLKSRTLGNRSRGLSNFLFIPKGEWSGGMTASYAEVSTRDMELFDMVKDVNLGAHSFSIKPYVQYAFGNNITAGVRLGYTDGNAVVDSFNLDFMDDANMSFNGVRYENRSFMGALFLRQYIGMSRRGRFGIFNELELAFSGGNSEFSRPVDGVSKNTHTRYFKTALNFAPGVSVFVMRNVSFDVSVGALGFNIQNEHQMENGVDKGTRTVSGMSFRWNLLNINFGLGIHI